MFNLVKLSTIRIYKAALCMFNLVKLSNIRIYIAVLYNDDLKEIRVNINMYIVHCTVRVCFSVTILQKYSTRNIKTCLQNIFSQKSKICPSNH